MKEIEYFNKSLVSIKVISSRIARDFVIKYHYTHRLNLCKVAYGVYYKLSNKNLIGEEYELIGACVFSHAVGRLAATSISSILNNENVFELVRLVIKDGFGKNIESYAIGQCIKHIKSDFPNIKCILSYADGEQNHSGKIYQATNFIYQGCGTVALMPNYSVSLTGPPDDYKWIHSRTVSSRWGSHNVDHLKKVIGKTFYRKKESNKHRYVLFISNKSENKDLIKSLKHPSLPYPKECNHKDEIEKIVAEKEENRFF